MIDTVISLTRKAFAGTAMAALLAGAAHAGIPAAAFHHAGPADNPWISSTGGTIYNTDTASSHNVVADVGVLINQAFSIPGTSVYVDQQNSATRTVCWMRAVNVLTGATYTSASGAVPLPPGASTVFTVPPITGLSPLLQTYAVGIICSLPPKRNGLTTQLRGTF